MKYPVSSSLRHRGKALEVDTAKEMVTLLGITGEPIGSLPWDYVIDQIMAYRKVPTPLPKETRKESRISLSFQVKYKTPEGYYFDSRGGGIGAGGLFIESTDPLAVGTRIALEFSLPMQPAEWIRAKGVVAWVCPKADQYTFSPGMGIRFDGMAPEVRARIQDMVDSLEAAGQAA